MQGRSPPVHTWAAGTENRQALGMKLGVTRDAARRGRSPKSGLSLTRAPQTGALLPRGTFPTPPHPAFPIRMAAPARARPMEHLPHPEHPLSQPRQAPARSAPRWALPRIGAPLPYAGKPDGDHAPPEPARPAGQPPVSRGLCSGTPPPAGAAPTAPNGSGSPPGAPPARAPP